MTNEAQQKREQVRKELMALQASPEVQKLAQDVAKANQVRAEQLDRCLKVDTEVLRRKITI